MAVRCALAALLHGACAAGLLLSPWLAPSARAEPPRLCVLDAQNRQLGDSKHPLGISRSITHDLSLPRSLDAQVVSADAENFRLELNDGDERADLVYATLQSQALSTQARHGLLRHIPLRRVPGTTRFRSPFLRLVSDATDASAPDVGMQLLVARLGDQIVATVSSSDVSLSVPVGLELATASAREILHGTLRVFVLRTARGGAPVLGSSDAEAIELASRQIEIANEIWAQCFITFGEPRAAQVNVVNPPVSALLAVSDLEGLPARGGGVIQLRAANKRIGPIPTLPGALPEQTAAAIARALRAQGFSAEISVNPRADFGAHASADVIVRDRQGLPVPLSAEPGVPLSTDGQQQLVIGQVDLSDGITEFDNTISAVGTLEERTLVKLLSDGDPTTIDLFLINRFLNRDRQGEAFIEADGSSMANTLIFDRNAVRYERQAWVQAHELGHVLLDEPLHPDNVGPDRPWLLMDADARQGRVVGPKRLSDDECEKVRRRSGPSAHPVLLRTADPH